VRFQILDTAEHNNQFELAIVAHKGELLVDSAAETTPRVLFEYSELRLKDLAKPALALGFWDGRKVSLVLHEHLDEPSEQMSGFVGHREILPLLSPDMLTLTTRASQLSNWVQKHRYCGVCGSSQLGFASDTALVCADCGNSVYPRLSPCVIGVVIRGAEILLAQGVRHKNIYSCLAGFIEAGESAEQAFHREVHEEVGLKVKNLRYLMSQSWPFPDQLMLGFCAEYESGEILIDEAEIVDAQWFDRNKLPSMPPEFTISRQIINTVIRELG
jgi:NAD+ diphosphatase